MFDALPLRIHCHFRAIDAAMKSGGNKAWYVAHRCIGGTCKQVDELLLIRWLDREYINKSNEFGISAIVVM